MAGEVKLQVDELLSTSKEVERVYESYEVRLNLLESSMSEVFHDFWKGAAQQAFASEWEDWHTHAVSIARLLARMSGDLESYTHTAVAGVEENAQKISTDFSMLIL